MKGKWPENWDSFLAKLLTLVVLLIVLIPKRSDNEQLRKEIQLLQKEIHLLKEELQFSEKENKALKNDPGYVEYILRNHLFYGYKSEYIWKPTK